MTDATVQSPRDFLAAGARWRWPEIAFWIAAALPYFIAEDYLQLAGQVLITGLFAMSLDLILGYAGVVSLGHAAFFGLGAYACGVASKHGWGEPVTGLLIGGAVAGVVGYGASFIVSRFKGLALIMITLGLNQLLAEAANSAHDLTGGADGLQGVHTWDLFGVFHFDIYGVTAFWYIYATVLVCFLLVRRMVHSPFGLALRGIRENSIRMTAIGAGNHAHIRKAFVIAAVMAGVAGALLTETTETVSLETLSFQRSADVLVMLILGGVGQLYGGLVGAAIYMVARDRFSDINPQYWYFWIGLLLIGVVVFLPNGIVGGIKKLGLFRARAGK
jgi:branched-chain amino acid transport system permease protein